MSELKYYQRKLKLKLHDLHDRSSENKYLRDLLDEYTPQLELLQHKIRSSELNTLVKYIHSLKPTVKDKQKIMYEYNKIHRILEQNNT